MLVLEISYNTLTVTKDDGDDRGDNRTLKSVSINSGWLFIGRLLIDGIRILAGDDLIFHD